MKRAVNYRDRRDIARWLDALALAIGEAVDAGQDASRPARGRVVSRAHLRRSLRKAARTARALLRAGRRGLGPMAAPTGLEGS